MIYWTHVGRTSLIFFSINLIGSNGGTAPEALPTDTNVPFLRNTLKLESNLLFYQSEALGVKEDLRVFSDSVVYGMNTLSISDFQYPFNRVF